MDIRTCKLFAQYNKKTNCEMDEFIKPLEETQWSREFNGYFNSIKSLCNHLYISDFIWLQRFSNLREYCYIKNPMFNSEMRFGSTVLGDIGDYIVKREELDQQIILFVDEITQDDFDKYLTYKDSQGVSQKRLFGGLVLHFFNHQTHHRGMVSLYLENMNINNDFSNLLYLA